MYVADADDLDVARDLQAGFEDGFHRAGSGRVVVAEDSIGTRVEGEELAGGLIASGVVLRLYDVRVVKREAGGFEGFAIAFEAALAGGPLLSRNVGDAAAAALEQVIGREASDGLVVGADVGRGQLGK